MQKGGLVAPGMEHVLATKAHGEPSAFGGSPRPVASKGKKQVRFLRTKEGLQSMETDVTEVGAEWTLPVLGSGSQ